MTKAIIYQDEKSEVIFCVDGKIYFKNKLSNSYVEAEEMLKSLSKLKIPGIKERRDFLKKLKTMKYDKAAQYHNQRQISKGRKGKIFEGEFNAK